MLKLTATRIEMASMAEPLNVTIALRENVEAALEGNFTT